MCGRYTLTVDLKNVADRFGAPMPGDERQRAPSPKNGQPRCNPMTKRLAESLQEWKAASKDSGDVLVFGGWRYREPFERARDAAKLGKDVIVHSLRHTYISRLIIAGADVRAVQELAGHKTIGMTMRYAHLAPEHKQRVIDLLDAEVTAKITTVDFRRVAGFAASGAS